MNFFYSAIIAAITLFSVPVHAQQVSDAVLPEAKTALATKFEFLSPEVAASLAAKARGEPILAKDWMVAVANPHAATAGARVLKEGGTAADAMVAVQAVLGLAEVSFLLRVPMTEWQILEWIAINEFFLFSNNCSHNAFFGPCASAAGLR